MARRGVAPYGVDYANKERRENMTQEMGGFDALRIRGNDFTVTVGDREITFETPKDASGRIISVNGNGKIRPVTYEDAGSGAMGAFAGVEYEQVYSDLPDLMPPALNNVGVESLEAGRYRLSVSGADYSIDPRGAAFFFFSSWEGSFEEYIENTDGSVSVIFNVSPDVANARVHAGVGDGLGQSGRKTVLPGGGS